MKNVSEYSKIIILHRRTFKEYYILEQKLSAIHFVWFLFRLIHILEMANIVIQFVCLANHTRTISRFQYPGCATLLINLLIFNKSINKIIWGKNLACTSREDPVNWKNIINCSSNRKVNVQLPRTIWQETKQLKKYIWT